MREAEEGFEGSPNTTGHQSMAATADGLPADVLGAIRRCLPIDDYIRFPAVCRAWRSAAREQENIPHPPRGRPWLFTLSAYRPMIYAIDCLGDAGAPKVYTIPLPDDLRGHQLVSSLGPSLLLQSMELRPPYTAIRLFNPFSAHSSACLPPSATVAPPSNSGWNFHDIHTIVTDADSGIALALLDSGKFELAYTRLGCSPSDCRWIDLTHLTSGARPRFQAAVLYKAGLFCAVDQTGNMVSAFDFSSAPAVRMADMTSNLPPYNYPDPYTHHSPVEWCCYQSSRLVKSGPSLFLVRWRTILKRHGVRKRREIDVYRLDDGSHLWVPVKSLGDISFFLGLNESISMSAADFPELKRNRVYLPHDATHCIAGNDDDDDLRPDRTSYFGEGRDDYERDSSDEDDEEIAIVHHLVYNLEDESWGVVYDGIHNYLSAWLIPCAPNFAPPS